MHPQSRGAARNDHMTSGVSLLDRNGAVSCHYRSISASGSHSRRRSRHILFPRSTAAGRTHYIPGSIPGIVVAGSWADVDNGLLGTCHRRSPVRRRVQGILRAGGWFESTLSPRWPGEGSLECSPRGSRSHRTRG